MKQYFGIDIGGTAVKLGIVDETGKVLCKGEQSVNFDGYQTPVLDTVRKAAKEFLTAQAIPVENLSGIGVSATGQIDSRKGIVAGTCGNFPNYIGSPIKAALEQDFGLPVTVANDANCMTLGEVWVGGAQGYTDVIGVTLGTGVGGGILTGGRLLEGARGLGGELGHYRTHALDGVDCTCGAKGCWERYAATTALVRAAQEENPAWKDGRAIFAAAEAGDKTVLALLDAWTDEIAQGLAGMVHIFNPPLILIGGGVSAQQKLLIEPCLLYTSEVDELVACGVDILAVQGTGALRPDGSTSAQFIRAIKAKYPEQLVMADCDNFENAMLCAEAGADFVGTTMRGYTPETTGIDDIDFDFIRKLAAECPAKIIAEGHIHYPEQAVKALEAGAFALVVGGAITRPAEITARFTGAINAAKK